MVARIEVGECLREVEPRRRRDELALAERADERRDELEVVGELALEVGGARRAELLHDGVAEREVALRAADRVEVAATDRAEFDRGRHVCDGRGVCVQRLRAEHGRGRVFDHRGVRAQLLPLEHGCASSGDPRFHLRAVSRARAVRCRHLDRVEVTAPYRIEVGRDGGVHEGRGVRAQRLPA